MRDRQCLKPKLSANGSVLLDLLRFGAACAILLSHLGHPGLSVGFPDYTVAGHLAVAIFFVLSGFVIRYVTLTRKTNAIEYLIDRGSRIYSVLVPALVFSVLCEMFSPISNSRKILAGQFLWHKVTLPIGANLVFQAQDWGYEVGIPSNDVFWSLSFECLYYAIYGLLFYRVRGRGALCFILLSIAGPSIALMFPVWLLGCFVFDVYEVLKRERHGLWVCSLIFAGVLCVLFIGRVPVLELTEATNEAHRTAWLSRALLQVPHHQILFVDGRVPWLTRASISFVLVGLTSAVFLLWSLLLLESLRVRVRGQVERLIRVVADSTFALYLLHLPLLIVFVTATGKPIQGLWATSAVLSLVVLVCVALTPALSALKRYMRFHLRSLILGENL